jgi:glucose 1-dehydrogenase
MRAIVVTPKTPNSLELDDLPVPVPKGKEILLEVERIGICGTDRDIISGFYGEPPEGSTKLVLGHESISRVAKTGKSVRMFKVGDLVVPTVRRKCPENCLSCRSGESDMCLTGHYREHGIKQLDGFASDFAISDSSFVVKLPTSLAEVGVLLEPLTIVEKGLFQTYSLQSQRLRWKPKKALVLGAGPVGLLATAALRLKNLEVDTVATRSEDSLKAKLVESTGAKYVNSSRVPLHSLDYKYDMVFEITGSPSIAVEAQDLIGVNGVVCYLGIYREDTEFQNVGKLFTELVLGNKLHFGSVNANRSYFVKGVDDLVKMKRRWPGFLEKMITGKNRPEDYAKAYSHEDQEEIKRVIEFKGSN